MREPQEHQGATRLTDNVWSTEVILGVRSPRFGGAAKPAEARDEVACESSFAPRLALRAEQIADGTDEPRRSPVDRRQQIARKHVMLTAGGEPQVRQRHAACEQLCEGPEHVHA